MDSHPSQPKTRSWSIYGRPEITARYEILHRIGSGSYADVYRARRKSDNLTVALKEIHDYQSSIREIDALQILRNSPNVVDLIEYFWDEDEDAVLVLEFLAGDLVSVIKEGKKNGGIRVSEAKRWMMQVLKGVEDCHRMMVVHRDLKPSNLLISESGVLKLADFGQARVLQESAFISVGSGPLEQDLPNEAWTSQQHPNVQELNKMHQEAANTQESRPIYEEDYLREVDGLKAKYPACDADKETTVHDGDASCLATCSTGDIEDDDFKGLTYSYEAPGIEGENESGALTSCVGTRWFRAPELLYGSTSYGLEVDLWSLGCIFAELLSLDPLFPGTSDLDQIAKIITVLGDMNEETWPGCSNLPDYSKISFNKIENPVGLEACLRNRSPSEVNIVRKLLRYDPSRRSSATELLSDSYFCEEPLPAPLNELRVALKRDDHDESSGEEWGNCRDMESDSDPEEFGEMKVVTTEKGFSLKFL